MQISEMSPVRLRSIIETGEPEVAQGDTPVQIADPTYKPPLLKTTAFG